MKRLFTETKEGSSRDTLEKMQKRVEYDLEYLREWSIILDLKIIVLTVWEGRRRYVTDGSYQTAFTCGYSRIFLSLVKRVRLCVLAVATMIRSAGSL